MSSNRIKDEDVADLVARVGRAADAIIRGDIGEYVALVRHADDYTLLPPNGGPARHGFDSSPASLAALRRMFISGEARVEVAQSYASGDLVVLVLIERQHGVVGGLPDQDCSLRVTLVFRRDDSGWRLLHRHADPLVQQITLREFAKLRRQA